MGDEMRPEYDMRGGVRGKYFDRFVATNVVATTTSGNPANWVWGPWQEVARTSPLPPGSQSSWKRGIWAS